ncbi:hypothetical protein [Streptomyces sp. NPDC048442]|uniref:DUF7848 domain-containing protein n=1 Tax=Streptomyces sp. NPDC048442 TaxID=3154823 RepID=UPI003415AA0F
MAGRSVMRFVPYGILQDPLAEPEYEAECVSGDEADCSARSGRYPEPEPVETWQLDHTRATGHRRFRRAFHDYALTSPPDGSACSVVPSALRGTG